jgi:diaminopimelate epimerase
MRGLPVVKSHAYGNDFVLVPLAAVSGEVPVLARALCDRHRGVGADGLILHEIRKDHASMLLWNADGSPSELSGNGLRCLAALVARLGRFDPAGGQVPVLTVDTSAGQKTLELLERDGPRYRFRAAMGRPENVRLVDIDVAGEQLQAVILSIGNPQCVVLGPLPGEKRFRALGSALATHPMFEAGTNVEFAQVETPERIKILIWERGVGPTSSSGTGSSAAAVAATAFGGAARALDVVTPGGTQQVEWTDDGIVLTGWAELVFEGHWDGVAG